MQELDDAGSGLWTFHQRLSVLGAEIGTRMTVILTAFVGVSTPQAIARVDSIVRCSRLAAVVIAKGN